MMLIRTPAPRDMTAEVRAVAASLNASLPIADVIPLTVAVKNARAEWDALAKLIGFVAAVASFLAACGLYGVVAFGVAARQREFGIRMALGATAGEIRRLALRTAATIVGVGIVLGLGGAAALSQDPGESSRRCGTVRFRELGARGDRPGQCFFHCSVTASAPRDDG